MLLQIAVAGGFLVFGVEAYREYQKKHSLRSLLQESSATPTSPLSTEMQQHHEQAARLARRRATNRNFVLSVTSLGLTSAAYLGFPLLLTVVSTPALTYLVLVFVRDGTTHLVQQRRVRMALIDAIVTSWLLTLGYFWAVALYTSFFYLGRQFVQHTQNTYQQNLQSVIGDIPQFAWVQHPSGQIQVALEDIRAGDSIIVHTGETVPADGIIIHGLASIDQRVLTGEAQPAEKAPGEQVFAATVVLSGTITVCVEQAGVDTIATQIGTILQNTSDYTASLALRGEAIGDQHALPMLVLGGATALILGPASALTVLCAYIGYAMRTIGPLSTLNFLQVATQQRLLIKDGRVLETLNQVDTVIFDKTGTLTQEQPHVGNIYALPPYSETDVLRYAAAAEHKQVHPIARAILEETRQRQIPVPPIDDASYDVGYGLKARTDDALVRVGSARFMRREEIEMPESIQMLQAYVARHAHSLVYVAIDDQLAGVIELRATLRPEAAHVIAELQQRDLMVYVVSGDQEHPTRKIAYDLGVDHYIAEALPEDKASLVEHLQAEGRTVCFIGDGINDSIALKQANVSVSLHGAASIATETAHILLLNENLTQVLDLFDLAAALEKNMDVNFMVSVIPGVITISGVYLLNFGIVHAYALYYGGFSIGVVNAMLPLMQHEHSSDESIVPASPHAIPQI